MVNKTCVQGLSIHLDIAKTEVLLLIWEPDWRESGSEEVKYKKHNRIYLRVIRCFQNYSCNFIQEFQHVQPTLNNCLWLLSFTAGRI